MQMLDLDEWWSKKQPGVTSLSRIRILVYHSLSIWHINWYT
jgi:hypothetical protein